MLKHGAKIAGLIRHILTTAGGAMVTAGIATPEAQQAALPLGGAETWAGALVVILVSGWSFYSKAKRVGYGDEAEAPGMKGKLAIFLVPLTGFLLAGCGAGVEVDLDPKAIGVHARQQIALWNAAGIDPIQSSEEDLRLYAVACGSAGLLASQVEIAGPVDYDAALEEFCLTVMAGARKAGIPIVVAAEPVTE